MQRGAAGSLPFCRAEDANTDPNSAAEGHQIRALKCTTPLHSVVSPLLWLVLNNTVHCVMDVDKTK